MKIFLENKGLYLKSFKKNVKTLFVLFFGNYVSKVTSRIEFKIFDLG